MTYIGLINSDNRKNKMNIHYKEVKEETNNWVLYHKLPGGESERFKKSDFTLLASLVWPTADKDGLRLLNDFITWLFIFDDEEDIQRDTEHLTYFTKNGQILDLKDKSSIVKSYVDWYNRFKLIASNNLLKRFNKNIVNYFIELINEMNMKKMKSIPGIEEYKKARRETGAVKLTFDLIQIARKISYLEEDEMILTLYDLANDNVCWYNDVLSLDKELDGDETYNFVFVLEEHMGLTREKAIETVIYYANEALKKFNKISEINKEHIESNPAFKEFVTGLNDWIIGHYEWCKYTKRYKEE